MHVSHVDLIIVFVARLIASYNDGVLEFVDFAFHFRLLDATANCICPGFIHCCSLIDSCNSIAIVVSIITTI